MNKKKPTKTIITTITIAILVFSVLLTLLLLTACAQTPLTKGGQTPPATTEKPAVTDKLVCSIDEDCICQGTDKTTGNCYMGNKQYYDANVDKTKDCPDFCTGIAGNMMIKCIDNRCTQTFGCVIDDECDEGKRCVNNRCAEQDATTPIPPPIVKTPNTPSSGCNSDSDCTTGGCSGTICQAKKSPPVITTCEYRPEYACYRQIQCGCVNGACTWKEDANFKTCVKNAQSQEQTDLPV
jgi:eight-cysteine-cluster-containing protein